MGTAAIQELPLVVTMHLDMTGQGGSARYIHETVQYGKDCRYTVVYIVKLLASLKFVLCGIEVLFRPVCSFKNKPLSLHVENPICAMDFTTSHMISSAYPTNHWTANESHFDPSTF